MGYLGNVKKQYWISFFHSLIPAYIIERLFWQQRGMDVRMVVYTEILYALTVTLLEVPSGVFADRFGRKRMLAAGNALAVAELLLLLFARSFWQFALAIFLAGIGKAFSSGSENALLYDSLSIGGRQEDFEKHLGRLSVIDFTGSTIAAVSGGILAGFFRMEFNYVISAGSMCVAFLFSLSLKEPPSYSKPSPANGGAIRYVKQALELFRKNPLVFLYCLTGAVLGSCMIYLDEFWQIVLDSIGFPVIYFGAAGAFWSILQMPGNWFAYRLKGKIRYRHVLACILAVSAVGYVAIFLAGSLLCLVPMMLLFAVTGIVDPLVVGFLHYHTESRVRATVESFLSLGLRVLSAGVGLLFGYVSSEYSIFTGFLTLGFVCLTYLAVFLYAGRRAISRNEK